MNLVELYQKIPAERHKDIKVLGERVVVRGEDGGFEEYLIDSSGELFLVRSSEERRDILAIKEKLGIRGVG